MRETDIENFQASLLEILSAQQDPTQILMTGPATSVPDAMAAYVKAFDPRMVRVAAELVKQWGKRYSDISGKAHG